MISTDLKKSYINWINKKLDYKDLKDGAIQITTPFLDRHNDMLQIYAVPFENDKIRLTDDGYILTDLFMNGVDLSSSKKRKQIFTTILNGYGVSFAESYNELFVVTDIASFPQKKHMLIQAMMTVNDMFMTSKTTVGNLFTEDVSNYLESNDIRYTENIFLGGKSGYNHNFNFLIPHFKDIPERVIHTMNSPSKGTLSNIVFAWSDTRDARNKQTYKSDLFVFINDQEKKVDKNLLNALENEQITPVLWTNRDTVRDILSA